VIKTVKLLGASGVTVSKVMSAYTNHGTKEEEWVKINIDERSRHTLRRIFILKKLFPQKLSDVSFTNPASMVGLQLLNFYY
jgi:hypothetical protein